MLRTALLAAAVMAGLGTTAGQAATLYSFTWTETFVDGTVAAGSLTGTLTVDDGGVITDITGSSPVLGTISALLLPNTFGGNNNVFPLNTNGVAFTLGGTDYNLYRQTQTLYWLFEGSLAVASGGTLTTTAINAVPEPMSLALLGFGVAGLAVTRRAFRPSA